MLARHSALALTLPSDREIVLTRVFDAPRRLAFDAWTRPEHVRQWYGCRAFALAVCDIDLCIGGGYRYVKRAPDGVDREILPPDRLVYTEQYVTQGFTSNAALVTVTFGERDGRATLASTVLHQSREDRDGHLNSGMEAGAAETLDRLAAHLATVA